MRYTGKDSGSARGANAGDPEDEAPDGSNGRAWRQRSTAAQGSTFDEASAVMKALFAGFICGMVIVGLSKRGRKPRRIDGTHRGPAVLTWKTPARRIEDVPIGGWYWAGTFDEALKLGEC